MRISAKGLVFPIALVVALKAAAIACLYAGWFFIPKADWGADLWMTRSDTSFVDNLANFDGAWFVRLAVLGPERLASGDYDLSEWKNRIRVMDELGREQGLWPPSAAAPRIDRGYGFRHWPLFYWMIGAAYRLGLDPVYAAVGLANLLAVTYGVLLFFLAQKDLGRAGASLAVALSQFHPGGYALSGAFNEPLFLALAAGAMLAARDRKWLLAGALGLLGAQARIFGLLLIAPLMVEWLEQRAETRGGGGLYRTLAPSNLVRGLNGFSEWPGLWWALLVPLGALSVLLYFHFVSGDPFIFTRVHESNVHGSVNWPWLMMGETFKKGPHVWLKEIPLHALLLAVLVFSFRKVRSAYWAWMLVFFLFHTSNGNHSYLRYQVECLPMFIALAALSRDNKVLESVLMASFASLFGVFCAMFVNGYWVA